jgi:hypothetical protein
MSEEFNGRFETVRLERGESFGIPPMTYQKLAQASISCSELGGVEPTMIEKLENGEPGCVCTLFGKHSMYQIKLEIGFNRMTLFGLGLDSGETADELFNGKADSYGDWSNLVYTVLNAEGFEGMTAEQFEVCDRHWKALYRKWSGEG